MKATMEIPDDLYRSVKAKSALEGRTIREVAVKLFREWLGETGSDEQRQAELRRRLMGYAGGFASGIPDLGSNPKHLENFGRDSLGDS